ncbi:MAG TPA: hypothetical protein VHA70_07165 [Bauldia sp.]|nr:hypothetical protein [Bauldia sp.]
MNALVPAWLTATIFFLGLSLGALYVLAIHDLSGGRWGTTLRPALMAIATALPVAAVAMIVPLIGWRFVLPWAGEPANALSASARSKLAYFDPAFLALRTVACLAIWVGLAWWIARPVREEGRSRRAIGTLVLLMVTMLSFATDWMIAPDPQFYSTIYPAMESSGELAAAFALACLLTLRAAPFRNDAEPENGTLLSEDIANLLFGFVLLWTYMTFMQWLIVWSGDLPDEIGWYLARGGAAWTAVLLVMVALHFALPSAALLSGSVKRNPRGVALVAALVVTGHLLDVIWRLSPAFGGGFAPVGSNLLAFAVVGAGWLVAVLSAISGRAWWLGWRNAHA